MLGSLFFVSSSLPRESCTGIVSVLDQSLALASVVDRVYGWWWLQCNPSGIGS